MVLWGPDEDPPAIWAAREMGATALVSESPVRSYEHSGTDMVRRDQSGQWPGATHYSG
jgi:hypothetical protein